MIYNFKNLIESGIRYGGNAGKKLGVVIDGENWMLKFPKSTKDLSRSVDISYMTSPLSEYIGSQIYASIGVDVHQTMLGICDNKLVVACKDFRKNPIEYRFDDYNSISNDYIEGLEEKILASTSPSGNNLHLVDIDEIIIVMDNNPLFINNPKLKERFWDMFIVDALIGNNDRNNGNWGVIVNNRTNKTEIAPVFDNGSSFNNKSSDEQMLKILNDNERFYASVYRSRRCIFSSNNEQINPLVFIERMDNEDCNNALARIVPNINLDKIYSIIYDMPNEYNGIKVISDIQKEFYFACVEYRYENVLLPTYEKIKNKDRTDLDFNNDEIDY